MIELNNKKDQFQTELKNDIDKMKQCPDILALADKTCNVYKMNTKDYQKLLKENVTVTYEKLPIKLKFSSRKYNKEIRT